MSKKCNCRFCQVEYPKHLEMMATGDIEALRAYAAEMFENWQMEGEESSWAKADLADARKALLENGFEPDESARGWRKNENTKDNLSSGS